MSFRIWTIFYVLAVVAVALAAFGEGGLFVAMFVLGFWGFLYWPSTSSPRGRLARGLLGLFVLFLLVMLLLPAVSTARAAARRAQCTNNLKQLALAMWNYETANGVFPPAFVANADGKPMHSWRVLLLPYLGEKALYNAYDFDEPWNGPNNSNLAARMPKVFRCPTQQEAGQPDTETNYFAVVGPATAWPGSNGTAISHITDGTSHTIMLIEASGLGTNWMEPRDVTVDEAVELLTGKPRSGHLVVDDALLTTTYHETSSRNVALCDARVAWMRQLNDRDTARALLTIAGGESIPSPSNLDEVYTDPVTTTVVKWSKVWALSVFVMLAVLPVAWLGRRRKAETMATTEKSQTAGEP